MKKILFWLGLALSAGCLAIALQGLHLSDFIDALSRVQLWWILPAIAVYFVSVGVRAWRWQYMLRPFGHVPLSKMYASVCIGYMGNNIYPSRIGELLRAYSLQRSHKVSMATSLSTALIERFIDGVVIVGFVLVSMHRVTVLDSFISKLLSVAIVLFCLGSVVFFGFALFPARFQALARVVVARFLPEKYATLALGFVDKFVEGATCLQSPKNVLILITSTVLVWLMETVKYWLIWQGFSTIDGFRPLVFQDLMLFNGMINLSTIIPSGPGFVGTYEAVGKTILQNMGIAGPLALSYTLVMHIALWLPVTLLGGFFMLKEGMGWADMKALQTKPAH